MESNETVGPLVVIGPKMLGVDPVHGSNKAASILVRRPCEREG